ncbi:MAG: hypothetical protein ACKO8I_06995 [Cyanobacteriota bacterium]
MIEPSASRKPGFPTENGTGSRRRIRIIVIYAPFSKQILCYCLYPLLITLSYRIQFIHSTSDPAADLNRIVNAEGDLLLCAGILRGIHTLQPEIVMLLRKARSHYPRMYYFDDQDSCVIHSSPYMQFFDRWLKKQVYKNPALYTRSFQGGRIYAQYFCRAFGADPVIAKPIQVVDPQDLPSIRLAWSICIGVYPPSLANIMFAVSKKLPLPLIRAWLFAYHHAATLALALRYLRWTWSPLRRQSICLARLAESKYSASINCQRLIYRTLGRQSPEIFATDKVPLRTYQRELFWSEACLSPFGWGEVCFRDAEAIRAGAVLVKPSMQHLQTWPDLYEADLSVPIDWGGSGLLDRVTTVLTHRPLARRLRRQAVLAMIRANLGLSARVRRVIEPYPEG